MRSATSKISLVNDATVLPFFEACAASDCAVSDSTGISCFVMRPWLRREYVHQAMRPECTDGSRHSLGTQRRGAAPESFARGPDVQEAPQGRGRLTHVRIERVREAALAREQRRRRDRAGNRHDAAKVVARVPQIREDSMDGVLSLRDVDDRIRRTDTLNHAME